LTLPNFVRTFWYSAIELGQTTARHEWGAVATDDRYPLVWDANNATVLKHAPALTVQQLRADLTPALLEAGAPYEHVEFWEVTDPSPALQEYRRTGERPDPDVVMALHRRQPVPLSEGVEIVEVVRPDGAFWDWYRESLREFSSAHSDQLLDQMTVRTETVFVSAGLRFYVGMIGGQRAGYASLLSLGGTGYLDNVVTMPEFRRRGVATATVTAAVKASLAAGDRNVFLLAEKDGDPQRLYERLGFRVTSTIESFTRLIDRTASPA
jgi:ribosomal protein S18 acetylase RimI-like enzyme